MKYVFYLLRNDFWKQKIEQSWLPKYKLTMSRELMALGDEILVETSDNGSSARVMVTNGVGPATFQKSKIISGMEWIFSLLSGIQKIWPFMSYKKVDIRYQMTAGYPESRSSNCWISRRPVIQKTHYSVHP